MNVCDIALREKICHWQWTMSSPFLSIASALRGLAKQRIFFSFFFPKKCSVLKFECVKAHNIVNGVNGLNGIGNWSHHMPFLCLL